MALKLYGSAKSSRNRYIKKLGTDTSVTLPYPQLKSKARSGALERNFIPVFTLRISSLTSHFDGQGCITGTVNRASGQQSLDS